MRNVGEDGMKCPSWGTVRDFGLIPEGSGHRASYRDTVYLVMPA